jgi:hypothetical protein
MQLVDTAVQRMDELFVACVQILETASPEERTPPRSAERTGAVTAQRVVIFVFSTAEIEAVLDKERRLNGANLTDFSRHQSKTLHANSA